MNQAKTQTIHRGFTLIELLVVIAIIAILAAILFPVFAQAKLAAKKAASISNQKQIGLSLLLYSGDHDDTYPRGDGCVAGSSLNPDHNSLPYDPNGPGCTWPRYHFRTNHYAWQKWLLPYVRNVQLFLSPVRERIDSDPSGGARPWSENGQIMGGFALNLGITGAIEGWNVDPTWANLDRQSMFGGKQTAIPDPSRAFVTFEFANPSINFAPTLVDYNNYAPAQVNYPSGVREIWARQFMEWSACTGLTMTEISSEADPRSTYSEGFAMGMADGSARFIKAPRFLAETPTFNEIVPGGSLESPHACGPSWGIIWYSGTVNTRIDYPLWGLSAE